ncbi:MAG: RES family NAD+ phosphorylase [Bacteroidetes bacterium]|nr:RES family NAD+ phosphorylase [Bacteroidota bacterium]
MTLAYRIARAPFPALDGEGARLYGGRWNSRGTPLVYAAGSIALAVLELLVHTDPATLPADLTVYTIELPDNITIEQISGRSLPKGWRKHPASIACARFGDAWAASLSTPALSIPSAIVPEEYNYLINPRHPDSHLIRVVRKRRFAFDQRLLQ